MTPDEREILIRLDEKVTALYRELLGDGQPGHIPLLEGRVNTLETNQERARGWLAGVAGVGTLLWGFLEWLFHHRA